MRMSAAQLLQPESEPASDSVKKNGGDEDEDLDLEALRTAALNSIKPKKIPVFAGHRRPRQEPNVKLPERFDVPPPGYPHHAVPLAVQEPPLLSFPPPFRNPDLRRSPTPPRPRRERPSSNPRTSPEPSRRRNCSSDSYEEVEEEVEVTASESEAENEEKSSTTTSSATATVLPGEPDDVLTVHVEAAEFTSMFVKKKRKKIVKKTVKRRKKGRTPTLSPEPARGSSHPRTRKTPEDRRRSPKSLPPSVGISGSGKEARKRPTRPAEVNKEEEDFKLKLERASSKEEREKLIARRHKFSKTQDIDVNKVITLKPDVNVEETARSENGKEPISNTDEVTDLRDQLRRKRMKEKSARRDPSPLRKRLVLNDRDGSSLERSPKGDDSRGRVDVPSSASPSSTLARKIVLSRSRSSSDDGEKGNGILVPRRPKTRGAGRSDIRSRLGNKLEPQAEEKQVYVEEADDDAANDVVVDPNSSLESEKASRSSSKKSKKREKKKKKEKSKKERKLEKQLKKLTAKLEEITEGGGKHVEYKKLLADSKVLDLEPKKPKASGKEPLDEEDEEELFAFFETPMAD